ncbi:MAG: hypothetical protein AAGJ68_05490 [Pseudomonadota bacterium]
MRRLSWVGLSFLAAAIVAPMSQAEDMHLRYITLYDGGWYNIDPIELHWKTPDGDKKSKKLGAKIGKGEALCYDLKKDGDIPTGSQVWLVAKIEAGETKSCKKDRKHIYDEDSDAIWWLEMWGGTLTENRCQNVSDKDEWYTPDTTIKGNSNACD